MLDGHPLQDYLLADLRRQIALVGQQVMLFDGSIADNIAYGEMRQVVSEEIERVVVDANAQDFVNQLPEDYSFRLGLRGVFLGTTSAFGHCARDAEGCADSYPGRGHGCA